jgi:hypothetical protein
MFIEARREATARRDAAIRCGQAAESGSVQTATAVRVAILVGFSIFYTASFAVGNSHGDRFGRGQPPTHLLVFGGATKTQGHRLRDQTRNWGP